MLVVLSVVAGLVAGRVIAIPARWGRQGGGFLDHPLLLAAVVAATWAGNGLRFGWSLTTLAIDVLTAGLVALAATDFDRHLLPKRILYPTGAGVVAWIVLATLVGGQWSRLGVAVASGFGCWLAFLLVHLLFRRSLGFGDVRLAGLIGFGLGWVGFGYVLLALVAGNVAGLAVALALLAAGRITARTPIAYGVALAGGALFALYAGAEILGR